MKRWMDGIFSKFGKPALLHTEAGKTLVSVILQSINSQSWQNTDHRYSVLGQVPRGQYIGMLPAGTAVAEGDRILLDGDTYEIRRLEKMRIGRQTAYLWSLCVKREG